MGTPVKSGCYVKGAFISSLSICLPVNLSTYYTNGWLPTLFSGLSSIGFIIYFATQIVPNLARGSSFKVAPVYFRHAPIFWALYYFPVQWALPGSFCTLSALTLESVSHFSKKLWFLLVTNDKSRCAHWAWSVIVLSAVTAREVFPYRRMPTNQCGRNDGIRKHH